MGTMTETHASLVKTPTPTLADNLVSARNRATLRDILRTDAHNADVIAVLRLTAHTQA